MVRPHFFSWTVQITPSAAGQSRSRLAETPEQIISPAGGAPTLGDVMNKFEVLGIVGEGGCFFTQLILAHACTTILNATLTSCQLYFLNLKLGVLGACGSVHSVKLTCTHH